MKSYVSIVDHRFIFALSNGWTVVAHLKESAADWAGTNNERRSPYVEMAAWPEGGGKTVASACSSDCLATILGYLQGVTIEMSHKGVARVLTMIISDHKTGGLNA